MIKVAVVGVGDMGRNHVRVLMDIPEVNLAGVADQNLNTANLVAGKYGIPTFASYQRLLDEQKPQAVVVAVPTVRHHEVALYAIEHGIHVLVEKPIASTVEEAHQLIAAAKRNGVLLAVGHIERFNPAVIELKRRIQSGELGRVFVIHSRRQSPFPRRILDVGVALDLATHELDMIRYLTGSDASRVSSEISRVLHPSHEDVVFALMRLESGVLGVLDVNWITPTKVREISVTGEQGMFVVNYLTQELFFFKNAAWVPKHSDDHDWLARGEFSVVEGEMVRFQVAKREPLRQELECFIQTMAMQPCTSSIATGHDGLRALALACDIAKGGSFAKSPNPIGETIVYEASR